MPTAAPHSRQRPTTTIETGHIAESIDQTSPDTDDDTEAALILLQTITPWLAKTLVEGGGLLDLRIKLLPPKTKRKPTNVYRLQAAIYQETDQRTTLTLRKDPNSPGPA